MSVEDIVASIDRHFRVGCLSLNGEQLRSHQADGACFECIARASVMESAAAQLELSR